MFSYTLTQKILKLGKKSPEQIEKFADVIEEGRKILLHEAFAFGQTASSGELLLPVLQRLRRLDGAQRPRFSARLIDRTADRRGENLVLLARSAIHPSKSFRRRALIVDGCCAPRSSMPKPPYARRSSFFVGEVRRRRRRYRRRRDVSRVRRVESIPLRVRRTVYHSASTDPVARSALFRSGYCAAASESSG